MAIPILAETTYNSAPDNSLAVNDVYKALTSSVVNGYTNPRRMAEGALSNVLRSVTSDVFNALGVDASLGRSLSTMITNTVLGKTTYGGFNNLSSFVNNAYSSYGSFGVNSAIRSISNSISEQIGMSLGGVLGNDVASINRIVYGTLTRSFNDLTSGRKSYSNSYNSYSSTGPSSRANVFYTKSNTAQTANSPQNTVTVKDVAYSLSNNDGDVLTSLNDLPVTVLNKVGNNFTESQIKGNVYSQVGNSISKVTEGLDTTALPAVNSLISNLSNGTFEAKIQNRGGQAALIAGAVEIADTYNIKGAYKAIAETVEDKTVLIAATAPLIQNAVSYGNIELLNEIASTSVLPSIILIAPDIVPSVISTVQIPVDLAQQDYTKYYQTLRYTLDRIEPGWWLYKREGGDVINALLLKENKFFSNLIVSQLNEFMNPSNYLSNSQSVYGDTNASTVLEMIRSSIVPNSDGKYYSGATGVSLDYVTTVEYDKNGNLVPTLRIEDEPLIIINEDDDKQTMNFSDDKFMLLGEVFHTTVREELTKHFPYIAVTVSESSITEVSTR